MVGLLDAAAGLLDDASALGADGSPLSATQRWSTRADDDGDRAALGVVLVRDTEVPLLRGSRVPLGVVVGGGAGQVAGPAALCGRLGLDLRRIDVALRDLDDLAGNARRVVAAVDDAVDAGSLGEEVRVHVELPPVPAGPGWQAAVDEVAAREHRLTLRPYDADPATVLSWIDAALDRETPFSFRGIAGVLAQGPVPGLLNLLATTALLFDGGPDPAYALTTSDAETLLERVPPEDLLRARRWFVSAWVADVAATYASVVSLSTRPGAS